MKEIGCSAIFFDKSHVAVRWEGRKAYDVLDFLFKDRLHPSADSTLFLFKLKAIKPQTLLLYRGEKLLCKGEPGKAAVTLLDRVIYELAKKTKGGLLFHAAALSRNGHSILIPGPSGSGKTFLAASLADNGYSYLTDEMTLVELEDFSLHGFYKPLHIKNPHVFKHQIVSKALLTSPAGPRYGSLPVGKGFLINCSPVDPAKRRGDSKAGVIIFPKYESGKELGLQRLTCANTGLLLMKSLINARNLTSHGFHEISALARKVPAYIMTYGNSSQVVRAVNTLLAF